MNHPIYLVLALLLVLVLFLMVVYAPIQYWNLFIAFVGGYQIGGWIGELIKKAFQ